MLKKLLELILSRFLTPKVVAVPASPNHLPEPKDHVELPKADSKGKLKLGVIVGHDKKAPGAVMVAPYGLTEYAYNSELARGIKSFSPSSIEVEIIFRDGKGIAGAYQEAIAKLCDCVIELHFDSFNGKAKGSTTLCSPDPGDKHFASCIHDSVVHTLNRKDDDDRGIKAIAKSERGGINVHSFPGGVNCLIEPFFGDNPEDAKLGMDQRQNLAKSILEGVSAWGRMVDLLQ